MPPSLHWCVTPPAGVGGSFRVRVNNSGDARIKLWTTATKSTEIALSGGQVDFTIQDLPTEIFVEGTENGSALREVQLVLEYLQGNTVICSDRVLVTVTPVVNNFTIVTGAVAIGMGFLQAVGPGGDYNASVASNNLNGDLFFLQNINTFQGGATYVAASGLPPVNVVFGAEPFTDSNNNGQHDPGEPFTDVNGNGQFDAVFPLPLLDAANNPPPAQNVYFAGPGNTMNNATTINASDNPVVPFPPNVGFVQEIDILEEFAMFLVWQFNDGTQWTLATADWTVRFHAVRVGLPGGGVGLAVGPNASVTSQGFQRNHNVPVLAPPVANAAGAHYE